MRHNDCGAAGGEFGNPAGRRAALNNWPLISLSVCLSHSAHAHTHTHPAMLIGSNCTSAAIALAPAGHFRANIVYAIAAIALCKFPQALSLKLALAAALALWLRLSAQWHPTHTHTYLSITSMYSMSGIKRGS